MTIENIRIDLADTRLSNGDMVRLYEKVTVTVRVKDDILIDVPLMNEAMDRFKNDIFRKASQMLEISKTCKVEPETDKGPA
jgi:hypothetical protein